MDTEQQPQDQTSPAPATPAAGRTFTQEELDRIIAERLQREREKFRDYDALRRKAEEFDKLQQAQMSEQEKLAKRLAELEQENQALRKQGQEHTLKYEIMLLASRLGIVDPEAAYRLLDLSRIEFGQDGRPTNLEQGLKDLIKAKPYLVHQAHAGSPTNPSRPHTSLTLEEIKRMSPEEINSRWAEVQLVLAQQAR
jgi:hypothetical protein